MHARFDSQPDEAGSARRERRARGDASGSAMCLVFAFGYLVCSAAISACEPPGGHPSGPCGSCADHASCFVFADGPQCVCNPGFRPRGSSCVDVDECANGSLVCGAGTCVNTVGSFECQCPPDAGTGRFCVAAVDVCRTPPRPCSRFATCTQGLSSPCVCLPGFFGDGEMCGSGFDPTFDTVSVFESGLATLGSVSSSLGGAFDLDDFDTVSPNDLAGCNRVDIPGGIDAASASWALAVAPFFDLELAASRFGTVPAGAPLQMNVDLGVAVGAPVGVVTASLRGSAMASTAFGVGGPRSTSIDGVVVDASEVAFENPVAFSLPVDLNPAICGASGCAPGAAISITLLGARLRFLATRGAGGREIWLSGMVFVDENDPAFPLVGIRPAGVVLREELIGFGVEANLAAGAAQTLVSSADSRVEVDGTLEPCSTRSGVSTRNAVSMAFHFVIP